MYDEEYRNHIRDFFDILEIENIIEDSFTFYVRGILHLKIMGHDALCTPYFLLEIWDFKAKKMDWMK